MSNIFRIVGLMVSLLVLASYGCAKIEVADPDDPGYRVIGYAVAFKGSGRVKATNITESFNPEPWTMRDGSSINPSPTERVIVADATLSLGDDMVNRRNNKYKGIDGAWPGHQTSHLGANAYPDGGNLLFLDGHTEWRAFQAMEVRTSGNNSFDTPAFWW